MEGILSVQARRSTKNLTKIVIREAGYLEGTGISGEVHKTWGVSSDRQDYRFLAMINEWRFEDPSRDMIRISQKTRTFKRWG